MKNQWLKPTAETEKSWHDQEIFTREEVYGLLAEQMAECQAVAEEGYREAYQIIVGLQDKNNELQQCIDKL